MRLLQKAHSNPGHLSACKRADSRLTKLSQWGQICGLRQVVSSLCVSVTCWHFSMLLNSPDLVWVQCFNICPSPQSSLTLFLEVWVKSSTPDPIYLISHSPNITSSTQGFLLPLRETSFICKLFAVANRYCSMAFQLNKISSYCVIHWAPDVTPIGK